MANALLDLIGKIGPDVMAGMSGTPRTFQRVQDERQRIRQNEYEDSREQERLADKTGMAQEQAQLRKFGREIMGMAANNPQAMNADVIFKVAQKPEYNLLSPETTLGMFTNLRAFKQARQQDARGDKTSFSIPQADGTYRMQSAFKNDIPSLLEANPSGFEGQVTGSRRPVMRAPVQRPPSASEDLNRLKVDFYKNNPGALGDLLSPKPTPTPVKPIKDPLSIGKALEQVTEEAILSGQSPDAAAVRFLEPLDKKGLLSPNTKARLEYSRQNAEAGKDAEFIEAIKAELGR